MTLYIATRESQSTGGKSYTIYTGRLILYLSIAILHFLWLRLAAGVFLFKGAGLWNKFVQHLASEMSPRSTDSDSLLHSSTPAFKMLAA